MNKKVLLLSATVLVVVAVAWFLTHRGRPAGELTLYGTVDLRQVELAFNNSERIEAVLVEEGARVQKGQVLARVHTGRLAPLAAQADALARAAQEALDRLRHGNRPEEIAQAEAQTAALQQIVDRLRHGSRPEEIAQAEAQYAAQKQMADKLHHGARPEEIQQAEASRDGARAADLLSSQTFERLESLFKTSGGKAVSQQEVETAQANRDAAAARLNVAENTLALIKAGPRTEELAEADARLAAAEQTLKLVKAGPRAEDIAEAEARLTVARKSLELARLGPRAEDLAEGAARQAAAAAQARLLQQELADAALIAPVDAVIRARLLEPGEMASPQKPVLALAVTNPKWIRAYVSEPDLGLLQPSQAAQITVDSFPDQPFTGWLGFISPVAEFTPRSVQTEELRTSLVYEVRIFVNDPEDRLRLGMPATVRLTGGAAAPVVAPPPTAPAALVSPAVVPPVNPAP